MGRASKLPRPAKRFLIAALCGYALFAAPFCYAAEAEKTLLDEWHSLYFQDAKAGYHHEQVRQKITGEETTFQTDTHGEFVIARANVSMRIVIDAQVTEDPDGQLIAFKYQTIQGPLSQIVEGKVEGTQLILTFGEGPNRMTRRVPAPEGLCPWALHRLGSEMGYEPGTTYTAKAFVPTFPDRDVEMTMTVGEIEPVQVFEVTKWLHRVDTAISMLPGVPTTEWVDKSGSVWLTRAALAPGFVVETRRTTKELALAPAEPAEILIATLVPTGSPIPDPRRLERLQIIVSPAEGVTTELHVPSGPYQQVQKTDKGLKVTIRRAHGSARNSYTLPYAGQEYAEMTQASPWLEIEDPLVAQMGREAVGEETDALAAARRIESYVRDVITEKNLSLGMATAAETALQKTGDCTEHAVLAAALARAAGMPSRVVGGLVYVRRLPGAQGGGFGYHMWAEVYVGEWFPLDAALGGHDATHLAFVRADLNESGDLLDIVSAVVRFLGKVKIEVIETEGPSQSHAAKSSPRLKRPKPLANS